MAYSKEQQIIITIIERMEKQRLPRLMDIRKKVSTGEKLDDYDIEFLEEVFNDTKDNEHLLEFADEEQKGLYVKVISLYKEITSQALLNEKK